MPIPRQYFKALPREEKIHYLQFSRERVLDYVKKPMDEINDGELDILFDIDSASEEAAAGFRLLSPEGLEKQAYKSFEQNFTGELAPIREAVFDIFKKTVLTAIDEELPGIKNEIRHGKNILLNGIATSGFVEVLDGVIEFRKELDKEFPGLADAIIAATGNALILIITVHCPIAGAALKASGIVEKTQELLSCENLQKASDNLKARREIIEQDKQLAGIYSKGEAITLKNRSSETRKSFTDREIARAGAEPKTRTL